MISDIKQIRTVLEAKGGLRMLKQKSKNKIYTFVTVISIVFGIQKKIVGIDSWITEERFNRLANVSSGMERNFPFSHQNLHI